MTRNRGALAALAIGAAAVTIALTAAAFWLSYEHLHDVAAANGLGASPARAWAWPATVDLFIVAGELLILRASLRGRVDLWAIALAASGSLGSIALNVFGVGDGAQPMEYIVAAVPPVAALLAFGALMRQVHEALQRIQDAPKPASDLAPDAPPVSVEFERAATEATALAPPDAHRSLVLDLAPMLPASPQVTADAHPNAAPAATPAPRHAPEPAASDGELINAARALTASGPLSLRRMQRELRIGQSRAQRIRDALEAEAS